MPLTIRDPRGDDSGQVDLLSGLVGVAQDPVTLGLRPRVGWMVRQGRLERALRQLVRRHLPAPVGKADPGRGWIDGLPRELVQLWAACDGAKTHCGEGAWILPQGQATPFQVRRRFCAGNVDLFPFARLPDGSTLALQAVLGREAAPRRVLRLDVGGRATDLRAWRVWAASFEDALDAILATKDCERDLGPAFP